MGDVFDDYVPPTTGAFSISKMKDPYGKDFGHDEVKESHDVFKDEGPVYRLRYEFVLLLEGLDVDFEKKYHLMRAIDDIIERHGLSDK